MLRRLAFGLGLVATLCSAASASAQTVPSLVAGQAIPIGQRVFLSENVPYSIAGTNVTLRVGGIMQRHLAGGGSVASAALTLSAGDAHTELTYVTSGAHPSTAQTWNGLRIVVHVVHHTGGVELRVERSRR